ncbi:MAG: eukaryotic-like serine/threonine-protein kinase [Microbacteriaceae bacterium]|nr:eukaryotic-like serine/threonine-protein kinase [Microbacteriaceae bacterium]
MSTRQTDPMIGRLIDGRYQVRSRIARGGMATVYLATDLRLERRVAIKIMHGHLADDSTFRNRFVQEARSAARLAHPNVVNVFDQGQDSDMAYLVMEYLPGITLRDLLKDYGKLTPEQTIDIMEAVLGGLAAAHKAGIVHRDLKPENVLLADDGRIKIGDFGLARAASANTATGQALLGTIAYLSPELVTRGIADARSDIYALGIMLYEMLTGEQPFMGEQPMQIAYQHANDAVPTPSSKNAAVPAELDELVLWATAKDPDHRPHDARAMLDRLIEVEKAVRGESETAGMARTMVMPPAYSAGLADAETQILNPAVRQQVAASAGSIAMLTNAAAKRRVRGWWLFLLVVLLAGAASGAGWYFGAGPGSMVLVPKVATQTPDAATAALTKLGFTVKLGSEYSTTVAKDLVTGTTPNAGTTAAKGSAVTVVVSLGPRILPVANVVGQPEAAARIALARFTVAGKTIQQFSSTAAKGTVLQALDASGNPIGAQYPEKANITLIVSAGPIPDVTGRSVASATAILKAAGLAATPGQQDFSDTIASGLVIKVIPAGDPVRVGDSVTLNVSRGPAPVPVPNVVGQTWDAAKKALQAAGFTLKYDATADAFPGLVKVATTNPAAGTDAPKGSTVTVTFQPITFG